MYIESKIDYAEIMNIKQIFHAILFNIRNYWITSILNKKDMEYMSHYMSPIPNGIWKDKG